MEDPVQLREVDGRELPGGLYSAVVLPLK